MGSGGTLLLAASQGLAIDSDSVFALLDARCLPQDCLSPGPELDF